MKTRNSSAAAFGRFLFALLLCFPILRSSAATSKTPLQLASANCRFAFDLFQELAGAQGASNIFISPYSASTALQMVSMGAAGTTLKQMEHALGTTGLQSALGEANRQLGLLINTRNTNFVLTDANALWYREGFPVFPSFLAANREFFGARVAALNFNDNSSVDIINAWASQQTHGKINQIVTGPIDPLVRMYLANAVYFLGRWENPFDTNLTIDRPFQLGGGGPEFIPMMQQTGDFGYFEADDFQAVRLPYKGGDQAMYVFLPGTNSSVADLLGTMNGAWWLQTLKDSFSEQQGTVLLPKFKLSYSADLEPPLKSLGMTAAFSLAANFSRISSQPLFISAVKQQAVVDVNELGTEAAAVTTVALSGYVIPGVPSGGFQMIVDRPFLFFIEDEQASTILFMGMVLQP